MPEVAQRLAYLQPDQLEFASYNPRKNSDDDAMVDLKCSILESGIQTPLLVRPLLQSATESARFEVMAGSRRLTAIFELIAEEASHFKTVPCLVRDTITDDEARELAIIDNLQRADIHPADEAEAYGLLIASRTAPGLPKFGAADVARQIGKSESYVATRLKLLELCLDAKQLFMKRHLTLDHALLLARLVTKDQKRALVFLLGSNPSHDKREPHEIIKDRLSYSLHGRRLIEPTPAMLKKWIGDNVLLQLKTATWDLEDADLMPIAGACADCPKRSGSNVALFGELTTSEETCTDPVCFAAKATALVKRNTAAAKTQGEVLLKISTRRKSQSKLDEPAVKDGKVVTRKMILEGQWVTAKAGSCDSTVKAIVTDGQDRGKLRTVCPDQACKKHKHEVYASSSSSSRPSETPEQKAKRLEKVKAFVDGETALRRKVYAIIFDRFSNPKPKEDPDGDLLRSLVAEKIAGSFGEDIDCLAICEQLGIAVPQEVSKEPASSGQYNDDWKRRRQAEEKLQAYAMKADEETIWPLIFHIQNIECLDVSVSYMDRVADQRKPILRLAKQFGVEAKAQAIFDGGKKAAATPAKKVATVAKKAPAKKAAKVKPKTP